LVAGLERLSEESRYRRFMAPIARFTDAQLRYLTEVDHVDHEALIALAMAEPDQPGIGVARYVRLLDRPDTAEAAVTVIDDYHGRGLGTILLALLGTAALSHGVRRFRAYVLEENRPMRQVLESLGAEAHHDSPGVLRMETPLPSSPEVIPDTPAGRVLKAVALGTVPGVVVDRRLRELGEG